MTDDLKPALGNLARADAFVYPEHGVLSTSGYPFASTRGALGCGKSKLSEESYFFFS
jgi:hypothetical protein